MLNFFAVGEGRFCSGLAGWPCHLLFWGEGAAEAGVVGGGEGFGVVAGGGAVAEAVGLVAEEGAAFGDVEQGEGVGLVFGPEAGLLEVLHHGLADGFFFAGASGVFGDFFHEKGVGVGAVEIRAVFPDVSGHVVEAVVVGRVGFHGGGSGEAVRGGVFVWKSSGEDVRQPFVFRDVLVAPDVDAVFVPPAGGAFPLGLGGEAFAGPFGVGVGIFPGEADDRVIHFVFDVGVGTLWVFPVGSLGEDPPLPLGAGLPEFDFFCGRDKDHGTGLEHVLGGVGEVFFTPAAFGLGLISGGIDEFFELGVGDLVFVDEEGGDFDLVGGFFFGILGTVTEGGVVATGVGSTGDEDHAGGRLWFFVGDGWGRFFFICPTCRGENEEGGEGEDF